MWFVIAEFVSGVLLNCDTRPKQLGLPVMDTNMQQRLSGTSCISEGISL